MNNIELKRAALYIRVSHEEQAKDGFSINAQKDNLIKFAKENNYTIVDIYSDEGISARKSYKNRKEFMRMIEDVKLNKIDIILFIKLDRYFRNIGDYYKIQEILDKYNVGWKATTEQYDTTTANGRFYVNIRLSMAQDEADRTSERIKFVFQKKVQDGEILSGSIPFGYTKENKKLIINEIESTMVKYIFEYFIKCKSKRQTMLQVTKEFNRRFTLNLVSKILINPIYIGTYRENKNFCEKIIDESTFYEVQKIINDICIRYPKSPTEKIYIFSGLLHCPICDRRLISRSRKNRKIERHKFHLCPLKTIEKKCTFGKVISEKKLEKYLIENIQVEFQKYKLNFDLKRKNKRNNQNIENERKKIETKLKKLKELYINELIDINEYKKDYEKFQEELTQLKIDPNKEKIISNLDNFEKFLKNNFQQNYSNLSLKDKRIFWLSIIDKIIPDKETKNKYTIFFK